MLELKTKKELASHAMTLAKSFEMVRYQSTAYIPADYETGKSDPVPTDPTKKMWLPQRRDDIQRAAARQFKVLFGNESELSSFEFMVAQSSIDVRKPATSLLVRTETGLKVLQGSAELGDPDGEFIPNTLKARLNQDAVEKKRIFDTIVEWVDGEEEARSLLRHLSTALAPGWSAVKYMLLLGEGRNGKGTLMKMLHKLLGDENVSKVTRQEIAKESPVVTDLNGKLLNLVYDGKQEYVKDSGMEKTLIAGEPAQIRKLYETMPTTVQTNALFVEGLNKEPKSSDKSTALQKRIVRFWFPNVYALDRGFEKSMLSDEALGAFLALLLDHWVEEDQVAEALAPTAKTIELQLEHMVTNSLALQYIKKVEEEDAFGAESLLQKSVPDLATEFAAWRAGENDLGNWSEPDVLAAFTPVINTKRVSKRIDGKVRKVRVVESFKEEAEAYIKTLKGDEIDDDE